MGTFCWERGGGSQGDTSKSANTSYERFQTKSWQTPHSSSSRAKASDVCGQRAALPLLFVREKGSPTRLREEAKL